MDRDVGVVILGLGELAHAVHERQRGDEAREPEGPFERAVDLSPIVCRHAGSIYDRRTMTTPAENAAGGMRASREPRRAGRELVLEVVFRPLADVLTLPLARLRVPPPAVVLANAAAGLAGALVLARGELLGAAVLLQTKTLLDNVDGQLARLTGRVTLAGRYLDTEVDLVVNAAIFAGLAYVTGQPLLSLASFAALTLLLALDYNATQAYREAHGIASPAPSPSGNRGERVLASIYVVVFAPLDRAVRRISSRRFERLVTGEERPESVRAASLAYHDRTSVTVLANLGLSTQLAVLGVCLVARVPELYLWLVLGALALTVPLQLRRERLARAALAR